MLKVKFELKINWVVWEIADHRNVEAHCSRYSSYIAGGAETGIHTGEKMVVTMMNSQRNRCWGEEKKPHTEFLQIFYNIKNAKNKISEVDLNLKGSMTIYWGIGKMLHVARYTVGEGQNIVQITFQIFYTDIKCLILNVSHD